MQQEWLRCDKTLNKMSHPTFNNNWSNSKIQDANSKVYFSSKNSKLIY